MSGTGEKNQAAWLEAAKQRPLVVREAPMPEPGPGEVLVRPHAVAINPIDYGIQATGMLLTTYPFIIGTDSAGEVVRVGAEVTNVKPGDRVIAQSDYLDSKVATNSAFQHYFKTKHQLVARIPDSIKYSDAAVLPLAMSTAGGMLFRPDTLALELPTIDPKPTGKILLIWGVASSVGAVGAMLAIAAGYEVVATASPKNFPLAKRIGVAHVFDYNSPTVNDELVNAIKASGKEYAGAFNSIMSQAPLVACNDITGRVGGRQFQATVFPSRDFLPKDLPEGITVSTIFASYTFQTPGGRRLFSQWTTDALASGQLKCLPEAQVVGRGLDKLQAAFDAASGISARKIVVELP